MKTLTTKVAVGLATTTVGLAAVATGLAGAGVAASTAGATATTTTSTTSTTLGPPAQGAHAHKLFFYVDTVTGGGTPKPAAGCAQTNLFQPGQIVVFRMEGVEIATGGTDLTSKTVLDAFVKVPGEKNLPLSFGNHGTASFWSTPWTIPKNYPLGIVNFTIWVTTKAVPETAMSAAVPKETGTFSQNGLAPPSRLTVVKA